MSFFPETIVVTGPTATGKTALAVKLAQIFNGEIVSVDSRQVFKHMDIGSGKDLAEYGSVPYHLIDVVDPGKPYDLYTYLAQAQAALRDIAARGRLPILCGGSTMYLDALLRNYTLSGAAPDMALRSELDQLTLEQLNARLDELAPSDLDSFKDRDNALRIRRAIENTLACGKACCSSGDNALLDKSLILGVYFPRNEVHKRVEMRLDARLAEGMIEEVKALHDIHSVPWETLERYGLEYRYVSLYLQGKLEYKAMRDQLLYSIRKFVKRQDIWFRKMERENINIHWLLHGNINEAKELTEKFLAHAPLPESFIKLSQTFYGNTPNK
jgi:tRNA dimethylallyltransferase